MSELRRTPAQERGKHILDEIVREVLHGCPRGQCSCHERGLNSWVAICPICGCDNPSFDRSNDNENS